MKPSEDWIFKNLRPILFCQDPEIVHERTIWLLEKCSHIPGLLGMLERYFGFEDPALKIETLGHQFPNPIGLAAGFDKDAKVYNPLFRLGFGFVEVGTVTPLGQPGNPKPRIFRVPENQALINCLGFNNHGVPTMVHQLRNTPATGILGINIGKNKITELDKAVEDYEKALHAVYDWAGYIAINVSSPNTERLRALQDQAALEELLGRLIETRQGFIDQGKPRHPLLLKIAPDLTDEGLQDVVTLLKKYQLDGVIATNTTLSREKLDRPEAHPPQGGVSGKPVKDRSTQMIAELYRELGQSITIVGVGGVFTGRDAFEKIQAGASLVQVYTGMIYRGPAIVKLIKKELLQILRQEGFASVSDAIGSKI